MHPELPLLVFTPVQQVRSQLAVTWGVETFLCPDVYSTDDMIRTVDEQLLSVEKYNLGDTMVLVAGTPPGVAGTTNTIHVHQLGEDTRNPQ